MALSLRRRAYVEVGANSPRCLSLVPSSHKTSRVVIGNKAGQILCFGIKRGSPVAAFRVQAADDEAVCAVRVVKDRTFAAVGTQVHGFSKKGKGFYDISTFMAEPIRFMTVWANTLHLASDYVYNLYVDSKDTHRYLAADRIHDLQVVRLPDSIGGEPTTESPTPVLACADKTIRLLDGSKVLYEAGLNEVPRVLCHIGADCDFVYGTSSGSIGLISLSKTGHELGWTLPGSSAVTAIETYDLTGDGVPNIILGREDGTLEVLSLTAIDDQPTSMFQTRLSSSISSLCCGLVSSETHPEVVVATFNGQIAGYCTEPAPEPTPVADAASSSKRASTSIASPAADAKAAIAKCKGEMADLEQQIASLQKRYSAIQSSVADNTELAVPTVEAGSIDINDKFELIEAEASYSLTLELAMSIDTVLLQSDVPVDLLDVKDNQAVAAFSSLEASPGNSLLATYRCQPGVTRVRLKIRSIEGHVGTLKAYIIPQRSPKTAHVREYCVRALALHQRTTHVVIEALPWSTLQLAGRFSKRDAQKWVNRCLPGLSESLLEQDKVELTYRSCLLGTMLHVEYEQGRLFFKSDNISTISILNEVITREATQRNVQLDVRSEAAEGSATHVLRLLYPKVEQQLLLSKKVALVDALQELVTQEGSLDCLSDEYRDIVEHADELKTQFRQQPCHLERLFGMVTDLYIDQHKFAGRNVKGKVPQLVEILETGTFDDVLAFFSEESSA